MPNCSGVTSYRSSHPWPANTSTTLGRAGGRDLVQAVVAVHDEVARVAHQFAPPARCGPRSARSSTPISWRRAPAGLVSGPRRLKMVRHAELAAHRRDVLHGRVVTRREHEADAARRRCSGSRRSGARSMRTPSASSTSAVPHLLVAERLPCLATVTPAPAATKRRRRRDVEGAGAVAAGAAGVEDHVGVDVDASRRARASACARPAISSAVSPLTRSADQEGGRLGVVGPAVHDLEHDGARLVLVRSRPAVSSARAASGRHSASPAPSRTAIACAAPRPDAIPCSARSCEEVAQQVLAPAA